MIENKCRICENSIGNKNITLNATLYGTKGEFEYFICGKCGALQICHIPKNISEYYDSNNYYSFNMNKRELRNELLFSELKEQCDIKNPIGKLMKAIYPVDYSFLRTVTKDMKILDVGCGDGQLLKWLNRLGYKKLYGFEPFIENDTTIGDIKILKTDVMGYLGEERFDMITMIHALEHVYEQRETIQKVFSLLVDYGKLAIQIPFFSTYYWEKYGTTLYTLDPPRHFYIHTYNSIVELMKSVGFELEYFSTEFDPAIPSMAKNIIEGHTEKNMGTGIVSGTIESLRAINLRKKLKEQNDGAIATFVFIKK